jgi:CTP synthase
VYLPYLNASHETKTKPAQNSVRDLRGLGIAPDILVGRSEEPANEAVKKKLSLFSGVSEDAIALLPNAATIYQVPLTLEDSGIANVLLKRLGLEQSSPELQEWREVVKSATKQHSHKVVVGVVAKYMDNTDTYMSVFEALKSAAWANDVAIDIQWLDAEKLESEKDVTDTLTAVDGIVVPGGFGKRALEGKIKAAAYCLREKVPYLGLCLGLQMAVIAAARNAGVSDATSAELDPESKNLVINTMVGQEGKENTGGTMRLGDYNCHLSDGSLAIKAYGKSDIVERHRHRFECNNSYRDQYEKWGIRATGINPDNNLVEMIEGIDHPFLLASQFHPEFKSRPNRAHPMFDSFIKSLLQ